MAATLIAAVAMEARQSTTQQQPAVVPDLIGRTEQEARALLTKARLSVGKVSEAESSARPGTVIRQDYPRGARVKPGTAVGFVLASRVAPPPVKMTTVPDLVGAFEDKARALLKDADLKVGEVTRTESNARPDTVFKQDHRAGARVPIGTAVGFVIALRVSPPPVKMTTVPDLVGALEDKARALLKDADLKVGEVTAAESNARPGTVFKQDYRAGAKVPIGTAVGFVLALRERRPPVKMTTVPNLFGATEARARFLLGERNLQVGEVKRVEFNARPDTVFNQDYAAGAQVAVGTAVGFVLALPIKPPVPPDRGGRGGAGAPPVKMTTVPNLSGASEEYARNLLLNAGLKVGQVGQAEANAKPFTVYKQDYGAGAQVAVGTAVGFVLAAPVTAPPAQMVIVPSLFGATEEKARDLLVNAGLNVGQVAKSEFDVRPGTVFKQDYTAGAQVIAGTAVGFVVAVPITVEVPTVVGYMQGGAVNILRNGRLQSGTIKEEPSRLPKGQVLTQGVPAGTKVPVGSTVDLTVAVPMKVPVPQLRRLPELSAVALLKKNELAVGDITTEESREVPGTVLSQRPAAGTIVEIGTPVNFVSAKSITVDVPSLVNRSQGEALALLKKLELTPGSVTSEESRRIPETVLSQAPAAGTKVTIGTAVGFVTARPVTVLVPNVVSMQEAVARKALMTNELAIGSSKVEEARASPGSVLRQSIAAGTRVTIGTAIDLVTATRVTVLVPNIAGLKEDAATAALAAAELKPGVRYQESPTEPGTVLAQDIPADRRVPIETLVDFVVSAVETVPMPSVVGITNDEARQRLLAGRLSAGPDAVRPVRSELRGIVLAQSVEAGTRIPVGTAIVLTVSTPELVEVPRVVDRPRDDAFNQIASAGLKVGRVARRLSLSAGGTIVAQGLDPGLRVEFGTSMAIYEAIPRYIWAAPTATVFAAAAGVVGLRRRKARDAGSPVKTARPVPPLDISVKPNIHLGEAEVHRDDARAIRLEVRIAPIAGTAEQDITASSGHIIRGERRVPLGEAANEKSERSEPRE